MKITFDIECTPAEARALLGLPDVQAVNDLITQELERRTRENIDTLADPKIFWERAMSAGTGSMEAFQAILKSAARSKE